MNKGHSWGGIEVVTGYFVFSWSLLLDYEPPANTSLNASTSPFVEDRLGSGRWTIAWLAGCAGISAGVCVFCVALDFLAFSFGRSGSSCFSIKEPQDNRPITDLVAATLCFIFALENFQYLWVEASWLRGGLARIVLGATRGSRALSGITVADDADCSAMDFVRHCVYSLNLSQF